MYELTFDNTLVKQGEANWARALLDADIDLEGTESVFWFAVHDPVDSEISYRVGRVRLDTTTLVTLLQQSAIGELSLMAEDQVDLKPTGIYDCETASYMAIIAAYYRGTVKEYDAWAVSPMDVMILLSRNTFFQTSVNDALRKAGYEGASGQNGIPLIYKDWARYVPPKIPSDCGFATTGGGEASEPPEGFEDVGMADDVKQAGFPLAVAGAAVGAVAALVGASFLRKKGAESCKSI